MLNWLKRTKAASVSGDAAAVWRAFVPEGMLLGTFEAVGSQLGAIPLRELTVPTLVGQLQDEGFALPGEATAHLSWEALYDLLEDQSYSSSLSQLELPPLEGHVPELQSRNSLVDTDFGISIAGWRHSDGRKVANATRSGGLLLVDGRATLLGRPVWETVEQVAQFSQRPIEEHNDTAHRRRWGQIRRSAIAARAPMDQFLYKSVVLSPDTIDINMRKSDVGGSRMVEIMPGFAGEPTNWLDVFDSYRTVPDRYDISTPEGIVQVLITPEVRTVLRSIRELDGRRVAGSRAEAFLVNPYATLGQHANTVIDENQFERARMDAGIVFEHFVARVERDPSGYPEKVGLLIERPDQDHAFGAEERFFGSDEEADHFLTGVGRALENERQLFAWDGYDFELLGDTPTQLAILQLALIERQQPRILVQYSDVYDLSAYTSRVDNIGQEQPYYSPYIAKNTEEWWPESIINLISFRRDGETEPVVVAIDDSVREQLKQKIAEAEKAGFHNIEMAGFPEPLPLSEAKDISRAFEMATADVKDGQVPKISGQTPNKADLNGVTSSGKRQHLVLKANISVLDYDEVRREILATFDPSPALPSALKPSTRLLPHQLFGVAWLQHLFRHAPNDCRGAVIADDMGLGKTLQLLTFLAWAFETDPDLPPALIVAPVSLLENWAEEIDRFFVEGSLSCLIAYGVNLSTLRVPAASVDEQLRTQGLVKFLRPGWLGKHKIVLTTYETLRDLEFSFAAEKWSLMACDEAQKIKNPNAMVTRAAKKQNVIFKIACTGTPVENSLSDLWCLFDFVQAGLLGALNEFGKRYRRPCEATVEDAPRIEELRRLIAPQILRRMKAEVASLPEKHHVPIRIPLSNLQRTLYTHAVNGFKAGLEGKSPSPFKNHLGLLQFLRTVCTNPHPPGQGKFKPQVLAQHRIEAPKLGWLLEMLETIRERDEKVIVFCEFREMQQMLAYYINEAFGFLPDIINGDVSASAKHIASRQKRIKAFQVKPGFGVIVLSPVAVGFGVNVQEANHVIHYTRTWNPAKEDQATDRSYRIGQKREVYVYCPIAYADDFDTFDVKLDELLELKRKLATDMLNGSGTVMPSDWSLPDIVPPGSDNAILNKVITLHDVVRMDWDYFECLMTAIWQKKGFRIVYRTPTHDAGVDVVALTGDVGDLIQCKSSGTEDAALDSQGVKDVVLGESEYRLRHPGVTFTKWVATNQFFNSTARDRAQKAGVKLIDQRDIQELLTRFPVTSGDVQRFLCTTYEEAA